MGSRGASAGKNKMFKQAGVGYDARVSKLVKLAGLGTLSEAVKNYDKETGGNVREDSVGYLDFETYVLKKVADRNGFDYVSGHGSALNAEKKLKSGITVELSTTNADKGFMVEAKGGQRSQATELMNTFRRVSGTKEAFKYANELVNKYK